MRCPTCGNQIYERLDYAIVRCTECMSLWDPYVFPGFPEPNVAIGELWDTRESVEFDWLRDEPEEEDSDAFEDEEDENDELDDWDFDEDEEDEEDDWYAEDEDD